MLPISLASRPISCLLSLALAVAPALSAEPLVAYGQVSRSDGLLSMFVMGPFTNRSECEKMVRIYSSNFSAASKTEGYEATLDFAACYPKVPIGTEFEALRYGTATKHYILFNENLRVMIVHPRGSLDYERSACEMMRGQFLSKMGLEAKCDAPKQSSDVAASNVTHLSCRNGDNSISVSITNNSSNKSNVSIQEGNGERLFSVSNNKNTIWNGDEITNNSGDIPGSFILDRINWKFTLINKMSSGTANLLGRYCRKEISSDQCIENMKLVPDGNPFVCFESAQSCLSYRDKADVLSDFSFDCDLANSKR